MLDQDQQRLRAYQDQMNQEIDRLFLCGNPSEFIDHLALSIQLSLEQDFTDKHQNNFVRDMAELTRFISKVGELNECHLRLKLSLENSNTQS